MKYSCIYSILRQSRLSHTCLLTCTQTPRSIMQICGVVNIHFKSQPTEKNIYNFSKFGFFFWKVFIDVRVFMRCSLENIYLVLDYFKLNLRASFSIWWREVREQAFDVVMRHLIDFHGNNLSLLSGLVFQKININYMTIKRVSMKYGKFTLQEQG